MNIAETSVIRLRGVSLSYGKTLALNNVTLDIPSGRMIGMIGPDGVGKSSLLSMIAGARQIQTGEVEVQGGDMRNKAHRTQICPRIAYMPQGLGKNLYPTLSVFENVDFFARLFGHGKVERLRRIDELLARTGMLQFKDRPAGKLSGGMKQKLSLCCSLIHDPDILILDEPTTGVDPLSRHQFWELIKDIRASRPQMSVIVATAYMEEAARFDWLVAMNAGKILATGTTQELLKRTGTATLDAAFIELLPSEDRSNHTEVLIPPRIARDDEEFAIEAEGLTRRFGDFTAVDDVSFQIPKGEIFGFLGSNGCGKTTTMKMLTGLLEATEGIAKLLGAEVNADDMNVRRRVGYMSQAFSLYTELTVRQNLELHAKLFGMEPERIAPSIAKMAERFDLGEVMDELPDALPLGIRQRLSLAVAMIHGPEILILDEPTSGVDPVARDIFWQNLSDLSRKDGVTIFVSTHFMNEAELCDRISLMHAGRVLVSDTAKAITELRGTETLEDAFISYLEEATGLKDTARFGEDGSSAVHTGKASASGQTPFAGLEPTRPEANRFFSLRRLLSYSRRESLELQRDPIRASLALIGSLVLMFVIGYGINMDIEDLTFSVLDRDDTVLSRDYIDGIAGSRYFKEMAPLTSYDNMDRRMESGEISLAIEIPPGFARDLERGKVPEIGAWIDGAMPSRAETIKGYVQGMHAAWLTAQARTAYGDAAVAGDFTLAVRYRYNPGIKSIVAIVPAVIPILLLIIPAMLTALSVVREKELGSIVNLYVTPTTPLEFLLGKQLPYVFLAMLNFAILTVFSIFVFKVPFTGSLMTFTLAAVIYVIATTAMGLLISTFISSQIAAIFGTALLTLIPGAQYSGLIDPVSSLQGAGAVIGTIYPTTYFVTISRGTFSKALEFADLHSAFWPLMLAVPVIIGLGAALTRKQAR